MRLVSLALGIIVSTGVQALETLSREELLALCRSESPAEVAVCAGYINGFLDGAFATDPGVVDSVVREMETQESFSERAIRTRLGNTLERFGPSYYAGFCIPADLPMDTIVEELLDAAQQDIDHAGQENARDYVYRLLQSRHPCQEQGR
jgi:hypothetical protein